jgi:hypothetical protein
VTDGETEGEVGTSLGVLVGALGCTVGVAEGKRVPCPCDPDTKNVPLHDPEEKHP